MNEAFASCRVPPILFKTGLLLDKRIFGYGCGGITSLGRISTYARPPLILAFQEAALIAL